MFKRTLKGIIYFCGVIFILSILAAACSDEEIENTQTIDTDKGTIMVIPDEPDSEVEIIEPETTVTPESEADFIFIEGPVAVPGDFSNQIVGVVKNNTNKDYDYLQISFTLYDEMGNVVDTAFANINNIKSGGTWKFEAMYFDNTVTSWELDEITGW